MPVAVDEVAKHHNASSCWVIIQHKVYDVTKFLPEHPGGEKIILQYAGKDATTAFDAVHPSEHLDKYLSKEQHLGEVAVVPTSRSKTKDEERVEREQRYKPPLSRILNLDDIEAIAVKVMSRQARAYYMSGADDEVSLRENRNAYSSILGYRSRLPVYVSFAGLAKLGHPNGDLNITRACGKYSLIQMVGTNPSFSHAEIAAARVDPTQPLFFQLYKHPSDDVAEKLVRKIARLGYKAIFLTVDAPVLGKRERDERAPFEAEDEERGGLSEYMDEIEEESGGDGSVAGAFSKQDDPDKTWAKTIPWLRSITNLPIIAKGIQSVEDAVLAAEHGLDGIVISNHGGRQLNYAPPPIEVLYKLRRTHPEVFDKLEVFIDGGIRRGTDVLKALCLGARAVGVGRPIQYANSAYGEVGIAKLFSILEREIRTGMRLLGATTVEELVSGMVTREMGRL